MIRYMTSVGNISSEMLGDGFFDGWSNPPSKDVHLQILQQSDHVVLAFEESRSLVIGFITAISDGILCAYLPLLEVAPEYRHQGIGSQLVGRMFEQLSNYYMIDLSCDENLQPFYEKHTMFPALAMIKRNYHRQSGK